MAQDQTPDHLQEEKDAYENWKQSQLYPQKYNQEQFEKAMAGGYTVNPDLTGTLGAYNIGTAIGKKQFTESPELQRVREGLEKYAQGYSGQESGRYRQTARGEIAGQQAAQQRQLASKAARGGVSGARAAAMSGQLGLQQSKEVADAERKMAMDSAQMERQGSANLFDFLTKTKLAEATMGSTFAQMQASQNAATKASQANRGGKK